MHVDRKEAHLDTAVIPISEYVQYSNKIVF